MRFALSPIGTISKATSWVASPTRIGMPLLRTATFSFFTRCNNMRRSKARSSRTIFNRFRLALPRPGRGGHAAPWGQ